MVKINKFYNDIKFFNVNIEFSHDNNHYFKGEMYSNRNRLSHLLTGKQD